MRAFDSDFKLYLQSAKIAEALSEQEEADFDYLMDTDKDFKESYLKIKQKFTPETLEFLSKYKREDEWENIPAQFEKRPLLLQLVQHRIATAIIVFAVAAVAIWFLSNKESKPKVAEVRSIISPAIELKLAEGKTINLSDSTGSFNAGQVVVSNTGKALTYANSGENTKGINSLTVAPGMDYQITLSDGSKIWLNSTTRLDFPFAFSGNRREIFVNGEAYLKVSMNPNQPFIVHLPHGEVEVLGTEFNVNSYDSGMIKVSLVEGSVALKASRQQLQLRPGWQGVFGTQSGLSTNVFESKTTLGWMKGLYYFNEAPLTEITKAIARWYNVRVVIDNARNSNKRFVGVLDKKKPLEKFLENLRLVSDIRSDFDKDGVLHFK